MIGIAAQPFWLFWTTPEGKRRSHAPDYFARSADGGALVMDCRPADRIKPRDAEAFAATGAACDAQQDCWRPPSLPILDYRSLRTFGGPSSLSPVILRDWSQRRPGRRCVGFIRPHPAPSDYLDTAVEPVPWPQRSQPRPNLNTRPWSDSERQYLRPAPADDDSSGSDRSDAHCRSLAATSARLCREHTELFGVVLFLGEFGQDIGRILVTGRSQATQLIDVAELACQLDQLVHSITAAVVGHTSQLGRIAPLNGEFDELIDRIVVTIRGPFPQLGQIRISH
ncbi:hypothetical protein [Nocardia lijiangensis]|uniref:hypothetical protein n=1 Tax=Nocardia lijiangensis TaxID=299618 RepID=UPI000A9DDD6B|nr:hypothetical protein [Nocardia lijiangensis]